MKSLRIFKKKLIYTKIVLTLNYHFVKNRPIAYRKQLLFRLKFFFLTLTKR